MPPVETTVAPTAATPNIAAQPKPATPPAGSAMDRVFSNLESKMTGKPQQPKPPESKTAVPPKPAEEDINGDIEEGKPVSKDAPPKVQEPPKTEVKPEAKTKTKANPWKMVDDYKKRVAELEKQITDGKTSTLPEKEKQDFTTKLEALQKRNEELENEMRFVDYSKSSEFKSKYDQPYEAAWKSAMDDLKEITVQVGDKERNVTAKDVLELVNMPLGKAREVADTMFGNFADDVMAHRKEIRKIFDAREQALNEARTQGAERSKQQQELLHRGLGQLQTKIAEMWKAENESWTKNEKVSKYVTPTEGDDEGNKRLEKGFKLVDEAFSLNPMNPNLSEAERAKAVKLHSAIRNRAAAFGRLTHQLSQKEAEIARLNEELKQFKSSQPGAAGGTKETSQQKFGSKRDEVFSSLEKIAKPR